MNYISLNDKNIFTDFFFLNCLSNNCHSSLWPCAFQRILLGMIPQEEPLSLSIICVCVYNFYLLNELYYSS